MASTIKGSENFTLQTPELKGRERELNILKEYLEELNKGRGKTVFISGEAGIGKTRLVEETASYAEDMGFRVVRGWCLADNMEPLMPMREAMRYAGLYHLVSGAPPPKVISAYLIDQKGDLIDKAEREETTLDTNVFASMLEAVQSFVKDSLDLMGETGEGKLSGITYDKFNIFIESIGRFSLAVVIEGDESEVLIEDMASFLDRANENLDSETGNPEELNISWFIDSGKYEGVHLVDDPKIRQENLFDNVLLGLQRLSESEPVMAFLDDLQWADPTTLSMVHYLSRNISHHRIMLIGTYRPEDVMETRRVSRDRSQGPTFSVDTAKTVGDESNAMNTTLKNMSRENLYEEIELKRLDIKNTEEVIDSSLGEEDFDDKFIQRIHEETGGNPLFIMELLKMLIEEEHIQHLDRWELVKPMDEVHLPSKVYDVVVRRLDRLDSEERDIMTCASVMGDEFNSKILGEVLGIKRINLLKVLNKIENTHQLIHSSKKKYYFDHSKIKEILYDSINQELKEEYHKIIAETYESVYQDDLDDVIYELAKHYYLGKSYENAFRYCRRAAENAEEVYANEQAIECYEYQLNIIDEVEEKKSFKEKLAAIIEETKGDIGEVDDPDRRLVKEKIDVLFKMGECLERIGRWRRAGKVLGTTLDIAAEKGVEKRTIRALIKASDVSKFEGDYEKGMLQLEKAHEMCVESGHEDLLCDVYGKISNLSTFHSEYEKAMEYSNKMLKLAEKMDDDERISKAYGNLGSAYYGFGEITTAREHYLKKLDMVETLEDIKELGYTLSNLASIYLRLQEYDEAKNCCFKVLSIAEKIGDKQIYHNAFGKLGIAYSEEGDLTKGLEYYNKKLDIARKIGDKKSIAYVSNNMGVIYRDMGDYEKAMKYYEKDLSISEEFGDKKGAGITIGNIGDLYKLMGDHEKAEEYYDEAISRGREYKAKDLLCSFLYCKADLYYLKGEFETAKDLNDEAREIANEIGFKEIITDTGILHYKLLYELEEDGTRKAIEGLESMLEGDLNELSEAKILFELHKISGDEEYRQRILALYNELPEDGLSKDFEEYVKELESKDG
ncbi:MAG: tetratricopeptide repeat protein [Thermoplasmata archaeon]